MTGQITPTASTPSPEGTNFDGETVVLCIASPLALTMHLIVAAGAIGKRNG